EGFRLRALLTTALVVHASAEAYAKPDDSAKGGAKPAQTEPRDGATPDKPGAEKPAAAPKGTKPADNKPAQRFDIDEYRVEGSQALPQIEV
ncbi:hypothetical protein ABTC77_19060, partial [Acinetobacter baumannii]